MSSWNHRIFHLIKHHGKRGISLSRLTEKLKIKSKQQKAFLEALEQLQTEGFVLYQHKTLTSTAALGLVPATITRLQNTYGFAKDRQDNEYFIPGKYLMGSMPEDLVLLKPLPSQGTLPEGKVVKLLAYGKGMFTGRIVREDGVLFVQPDRLGQMLLPLKRTSQSAAKAGDKVLAKVASRGKRHDGHKAKILTSYGTADTGARCAEALLDLEQIPRSFSEELLEQADALLQRGITGEDLAGRTDFRDDIVFTIDSADAKDLDDALSIAQTEDGFLLGVHIADVSHYVSHKGMIDQEALRRGTSIYYADQVIPMLPKALSNGICSLHPGEDRLTLSVLLRLNKQGDLLDFRFTPGVIHSRCKGVYSEVNQLLGDEADSVLTRKYREITPALRLLQTLTKERLRLRKQRGALELDTKESKILLTSQETVEDIVLRERGFAEQMVEECMLLANEAAATFAKNQGAPFVYRVHENPPAEKLQTLQQTCRLLGLSARTITPNLKPKALSELLESTEGTPLAAVLPMQVLRSMAKAQYKDVPLGHYGLALENYAHFTSPIRRYPDLAVHRILHLLLKGASGEQLQECWGKTVKQAAAQSTQTELVASRIELECEACYFAEYMQSHLHEPMEGIISGAAPHGLYVQLANGIEGLIAKTRFPEGDYAYDGILSYQNLQTGQIFRMGDPIRVECIRTNVSNGTIDFAPILP